jgi:uncharacterized integral membrane protein
VNKGDFAEKIFKFLSSLKLAVIVLSGLTLSLIAATTLESLYDTQTAQYFVYQSIPFKLILVFLVINVTAVMISRWPWQNRHIPFLIVHSGIDILLLGSWMTSQLGVDGMMRLEEGKLSRSIELQDNLLVMGDQVYDLAWQPPGVEWKAKEYKIDSKNTIIVDQFLSHADSEVKFVPASPVVTQSFPAVHLLLKVAEGSPALASSPPIMRKGQDFWLWKGYSSWSKTQAGGATLEILSKTESTALTDRPVFSFQVLSDQEVLLTSSDAQQIKHKVSQKVLIKDLKNYRFKTQWKFDIEVTVLEYIPRADSLVEYQPSIIQYGQNAPSSAVRLRSKETGQWIWLGLGDRASLGTTELAYASKRVRLPFEMLLEKFEIQHYPGSMNPSTYSSYIQTIPTRESQSSPSQLKEVRAHITMNEPFKAGGFTFYQSSYERSTVPGQRPTVSVLSVNRDPGRWVKYLGSLMIVLGTLLFFNQKLKLKKYQKKIESQL